MTSVDDNIDDDMRPLRQRYVQKLRESRTKLNGYTSPDISLPMGARDDIHFIVHQLIGTAKAFGFPKITQIGSRLERQIIKNPPEPDASIVKTLQTFLTVCDDVLQKF